MRKLVPVIILFIFFIAAITIVSKLVNSHLENSDAKIQQTCIDGKTSQESIDCLNNLITRQPKNVKAYFFLSGIYKLNTDYTKCIEVLNKAALVKPDDADIYRELAGFYYFYNRLDEAIFNYEKSISLKPTIPQAFYDLGLCYIKKGDKVNARKNLIKAKELNPGLTGSVDQMLRYLQ